MLEQLYIGNGAHDWIVNDIEVDGVSQLSVKDLPGALFNPRGIVAEGKRAVSSVRFSGLDVIESKSEVAVTVTYVGPHPEGKHFHGSIVGDSPPQQPTVLPIATKKVPPAAKVTISACLDAPLKIETLEISDEGTAGGAADWIVYDVRIDGRSQFARPGDLPGDMFSTTAIDTFVKFQSGKQIEIDVGYIGLNDEGICFAGRVLGTVVRDDYSQAPPDVRAVVWTSGQDTSGHFATPHEEVIARCNWRVPYVRPIDPVEST